MGVTTMFDLLKAFLPALLGFLVIFCGLLQTEGIRSEVEQDAIENYELAKLSGRIVRIENGAIWLVYKCNSVTEPKKKEYILRTIDSDVEVIDIYGCVFQVIGLISVQSYFDNFDEHGRFTSCDGPYVVYEVVQKRLELYSDNF